MDAPAPGSPRPARSPRSPVPSGGDAEAEARHLVENAATLVPGNTLSLLVNGRQAFPRWLDAIEKARDRVSMEMYIFADDDIGRRFGDALARAAQRGVTVRLLYDAIGCRETSGAFFRRLRAAGVHTRPYHRPRLPRLRWWSLFRRNHRKIIVCDGAVGFAGGLNIADEWMPADEGGGDWRDAAVELTGPAVATMEAVFLETWNKRAKKRLRLPPRDLVVPDATGAVAVAVLANSERSDRFVIRRAALHAFREARRSILLANPYFVPDLGLLNALMAAAGRGVNVRILVPAESDARTLDHAARATFERLLRAGVKIFEHPRVVHTKAMVVDEAFASIGSYNLDQRSLAYNLEVVVNAVNKGFAASVTRTLEDEIAQAHAVDAALFAERSLWERLLERAAWSLRRWL